MKRILFIATGGTISCAKTQEGLAPALTSSQLLEYVPQIEGIASVDVRQLCSLDSTNMSPREWTSLAKLIRREYENYDGFVVAHGTDTMAYGAAALSCLVQNSRKPVVFTGSQLPMSEEGTDAADNLLAAFGYAADDRAWGMRIAFGGSIIDGRSAYKDQTHAFDAFKSAVDNIHARYCFDGGAPVFTFSDGAFSGETRFYDKMDSRVAAVKLIPGMPACLLYVQGVRAIIVEGFGTGGVPDYGGREFEERLRKLFNSGVYVIIATQVRHGGTELNRYAVGSGLSGWALETGLMTTEFAAMKTMWALAHSDGYEEFKRLFAAEI